MSVPTKRKMQEISEEISNRISKELFAIARDCVGGLEENSKKKQMEFQVRVEDKGKAFVELLDEYRSSGGITDEYRKACIERLLYVTYDFHKRRSRLTFGIIEYTEELPEVFAWQDEVKRFGGKNIVKSSNEVQMGRRRDSLIFYKNTKPDVSQLEIIAGDFFRQLLDGRTAHGNVVVDSEKKIAGMYVYAIPGFISMRQLTDLAKKSKPYERLNETIDQLKVDINALKIEDEEQNKVRLEEKNNLLRAYEAVKELNLIDVRTNSINISEISGIIAKALCSSFFFEDWDRHKDNFGLSFKDGELSVASLDYDKSLSGIFGQDHKCYDWSITPKRLKNFPDFDCWYWPTSSKGFRKFFASIVAPEKMPKMYDELEAKQYSELKNDENFQRQAQKEWLKLIFIPEELRNLSVRKMASKFCDQRLNDAPKILEGKRKKLLYSLMQVNDFRERFNKESSQILKEVEKELRNSLDVVEMGVVLGVNWRNTLQEIKDGIKKIEGLKETAKGQGHLQLLEAISRTGVSFSPTLNSTDLIRVLKKINVAQSSQNVRYVLNKELGLDLTAKDARKIKEEMYIDMITKHVSSGLAKKLKDEFVAGRLTIRSKGTTFPPGRVSTRELIKHLEFAIEAYKKSNDEKDINGVIKILRNLGIASDVVIDTDIKKAIENKTSFVNPKPGV